MNALRNSRSPATIAMLFSLGGLVVLPFFSIRQFLSERVEETSAEKSESILRALTDFRYALKAEESARRGYLITRTPAEASAQDEALGAMVEKSSNLIFLTADNPEENSRALSLDSATRTARASIARLLPLRGSLAAAKAARLESAAFTARALALVVALDKSEQSLLKNHLARVHVLSRSVVWALSGAAALGCLGIISGLWLIQREMTAREDVDEELAATRARYESILYHSPAIILLKNSSDRILYVNRSFERILGVSREQVLSKPYLHDLAPNLADIVRRNDSQVLASGLPAEFEETDGTRTFLSVKFPLRGPTGETELCVMATDITALKAHESRLAAVNKELESFAYSVSHDLRAPLRAIDGFARILFDEYAPKLDDEGRRLIGRIRFNADRMARLIDDLLSFSRLGRQELRRTEVNMTALALRASEESASLEVGRSVRCELGALPPALGDAPMLAQVWVNLISNAYKYTRRNQDARVEIGGASADGEHVYWVKDNGVGFDPHHAGKLFEVFSRLHGADEFEGTGVGLALVRRVVERHGGRISASGRVGAGAEFRFTLPHGGES